jgi:hypothetical protein
MIIGVVLAIWDAGATYRTIVRCRQKVSQLKNEWFDFQAI